MWNFDSLSQVRLMQPISDPATEIGRRIKPEEFARLSLDDPILAFLDFYKTNNYFGDQIPHNHPHRSEIKQWVKKVAPHANKNPDGAWEMEKIVSTSPGIYSRTRIRLVPQGLTNEVISTCHNSGMAGHQSKSRTYEMLKEGYSWPLMRSQIFTFVDHCEVCQGYNMPRTSKEVGEYPDPGAPFRVVAFDFIGPLGDKKKTSSFKHILTVIDLFTRFVFLIPCKSTSSREVIAAFRDRIIPLTGVPLICQSDQEGSFSSAKFKAFCDDIGMCQKPCPQGSSNSNGCVERCNRSVQTYLKKMLGEKNWEKWPQYLGLVEFIMRNSRREDINLSPAEILFGFRCRGPYSNSLSSPVNALTPLQLWTMSRREYRRLRSEADQAQRAKIKEQTASTTRPESKFKPGELVRRRIKDSRSKKGLPRKWWPQWSETYRVLDYPSWGRYVCLRTDPLPIRIAILDERNMKKAFLPDRG